MAQQMQARRNRQSSPERWQKAARRAIDEGIEVRQVNENGMWVANSGTQSNVAYLLEIAAGVVVSCSCPAGQFGDPCCKHAARFYLDAGVLEIEEPEPDPSGPAAAVICFRCRGMEAACPVCAGNGVAALAAQAAALVAAAHAVEGRAAMVGEPDPVPFDAVPVPDARLVSIGRAGHVAGYDVLIAGDRLLVTHAATGREWRHVAPNYGTALSQLAQEPGLRLGWAQFPDDSEAIYLYDADDGCFGYALNLACDWLSEWGYAPFGSDEGRPFDAWDRSLIAA